MTRIWILAFGLAAAVLSSATMAFEEQKMPAAQQPAAQKAQGGASQPGVSLSDPGIQPGRLDTGTKIRVPGLGVIGEIPKMDFGLELLYGASQPKTADHERNEGNGVMGRVTVPLKSPR